MRKFHSIIAAKKDFRYYLSSGLIALLIIGINVFYFSDASSFIEASSAVDKAVRNESGILNWIKEIYEWLKSLY